MFCFQLIFKQLASNTEICQNITYGFTSSEYLTILISLFVDEKCEWFPTRNLVWLGLCRDMENGKLFITEDIIQRLKICLNTIQ